MANRVYEVDKGDQKASVAASTLEADVAAAVAGDIAAAAATEIAKTAVTTADNDANTAKTDITTADTAAATHEGALKTDVANAVGVLVADGVAPTQAHVNTLNTAWGLLSTAMSATKTATAAAKTSATTAKASTATAKTNVTTADTAADAAAVLSALLSAQIGGAMLQVTIDDTQVGLKEHCLLALDAVKRAILEDRSFPTA